ncbi:hypothetical protein E2C01_082459 [Portunus trituberculatus]|uniref:Uncharacterized protein n=1 Tax=Portunus trituberculatus TaxID=210409 RepID=A0A5B7IZB4_PORTR|nr:hypothetical protein [Portunus trituberculatus]
MEIKICIFVTVFLSSKETCLEQLKCTVHLSQEEEWWRVRRVVQRPLTASPLVSQYLPEMDDVAKDFVIR